MDHVSNINTLKSILLFCYKICNNFLGLLFKQWEDFHFTKEDYQNYGWCTTQNPMWKTIYTIRGSICSLPIHTFINMSCFINNQEIFQTNSPIHNINTRNKHQLHRPNTSLCSFQTSTFYAGIKTFNSLPLSVTLLKNDKAKFNTALRKYQHTHCFYSVDEFFMCKMIYNAFFVQWIFFFAIRL